MLFKKMLKSVKINHNLDNKVEIYRVAWKN